MDCSLVKWMARPPATRPLGVVAGSSTQRSPAPQKWRGVGLAVKKQTKKSSNRVKSEKWIGGWLDIRRRICLSFLGVLDCILRNFTSRYSLLGYLIRIRSGGKKYKQNNKKIMEIR